MPRLRVALVIGSFVALSAASAQQTIVVKPGDTLWALAKRYDTTVDEILEINGLTGRDLFPGAVLELPPSADSRPATYTVRKGDTLYDIAVAFDMSVDDLIDLNDLEGTRILVGQALVLQAPPDKPDPVPLVVTVQAGDSLWSLARRYQVRADDISKANSLRRGDVLHPGDELTIPGRFAGQAGADVGGAAAPTVTVIKGDSLWGIAQRYHTTVSALISANGLRDTDIKIGQTLKIVPSSELLPAGAAAAVPRATLLWPIHGVITSRFGYRRLRISGSNFHTGIDIDGETGDPIASATAGIVTFAGWHGGYGNLVIVQSGDTEYYYGHASALLVSVGTAVKAGQVIAKVGSTGNSTGSHLHFEIRVDGEPVDPLPVLQQYAAQ